MADKDALPAPVPPPITPRLEGVVDPDPSGRNSPPPPQPGAATHATASAAQAQPDEPPPPPMQQRPTQHAAPKRKK